MAEPPFAAVLFDLDGTVWDSAPGIVDAITYTLAVLGRDVPPPTIIASHLGPPLHQMLLDLGVTDTEIHDAAILYRARYSQIGEITATVPDGMTELLSGLQHRGVLTATATSKGVEPTNRMLSHFGLDRYFAAVAAGAMDSTDKDKINVIANALAQLGNPAPESVAMVGDRIFDIEGGRHFGLTTIAVEWGYAPPGELSLAQPDHCVADLGELRNLLLGAASPT